MNLRDWQQQGDYFDYRGRWIFYRREGNGEPLLCLHGFPASSFDYHKIWDGLTERFDVIAFDMMGYGLSDKPTNFGYTTFEQVDVLEALVKFFGIDSLHILAHDYGNTITQELLARAEEGRLDFEIKSICMLNGALFPETHRPILAQRILIGPLGFLFGRLIPDSRFKASLASVFGKDTQPSEEELNQFLAAFKHNNGKRIAHKLIQYMTERAKYRERWVGPLARTNVPFRFINGLADPVSGEHLVRRFRELMPHQDIIELPGVGHFPHFEVPQRVSELFFEFHERV